MPLINGQKMACEPCIRGHRSTKCTHANERLMVPVRKPGRPLSSCPHPSSRPCSCAAVTAAIPRKQKCGCGTSSSSHATPEIKPEMDDSSAEATPTSPTRASSSYRIKKAIPKSSASRKQSIDAAGLQRMDASQLNILPAYDTTQQKLSPVASDTASFQTQTVPMYNGFGMVATPSSFHSQPMMYPAFSPQVSSAMVEPQSPSLAASKDSTNATNGTATTGGCCGSKKAVTAEPPVAPAPAPAKSCCGGSVVEQPKPKSCCSSKAAPNGTSNGTTNGLSNGGTNGVSKAHHASPGLMQMPDVAPHTNGVAMSPFPSPVVMPNGMFPYFPQQTVFTYPPQYGSYMHPLQPEQWRQFMSTMNYNQPANMVDLQGTMPMLVFGAPETSAGTTHQCVCGDGCQCVGCASHPYNDATQDYVRSAWNSMMEDGRNGSRPYTNGAGGVSLEASGHDATNGGDTAFQHQGDGTISPQAPQTPSDAASNDEQTLSASDFFFVTYPFGDSCAGEMVSCPCGDDCECIGCVIHKNPDPSLPIA